MDYGKDSHTVTPEVGSPESTVVASPPQDSLDNRYLSAADAPRNTDLDHKDGEMQFQVRSPMRVYCTSRERIAKACVPRLDAT